MNKETLICIQDCHSYYLKKGDLVKYYFLDKKSILIIKDGFYLSYDCKYFMKLSEYRSSKIDKIHE